MTRVCVIGVSGYGDVHYNLLMNEVAAGTIRMVGAAIINQDEEREKCARLQQIGCRVFDDYRVMLQELAGSTDLCLIPTGIPLHRTMTVAALEAGMHVLVEKPAAGCLADARLMQAAASKADRIVAVGYQHLYAPSVMATKRQILNGIIGNVESIKCLVMWPRNHHYYHRNGWAGKLTVNGAVVNDSPFNNAVAHEVMMMLFQAGTTERCAALPVAVQAKLYRANAIESADTVSMEIETDAGVPIRFYATHACREPLDPEILIRGTRGVISLTHKGTVITPTNGKAIHLPSGGGEASRKAMMTSVLDAVQGGPAFICDLEMASHQTMVVDTIHNTTPIRHVTGETLIQENNAVSTVIPGIETALRQAYENNQLLEEAWS